MTALRRLPWSALTGFSGALLGAYLGARAVRVMPAPDRGIPEARAFARAADHPALPAVAPGEAAPTAGRAVLQVEDLDAIAREVVRALRAEPAPSGPPKPQPASGPEAEQARFEAGELFAEARAAREWTEHEALKLRLLLPRLAEADQTSVLLELVQAVNAGEIAMRTEGMPF